MKSFALLLCTVLVALASGQGDREEILGICGDPTQYEPPELSDSWFEGEVVIYFKDTESGCTAEQYKVSKEGDKVSLQPLSEGAQHFSANDILNGDGLTMPESRVSDDGSKAYLFATSKPDNVVIISICNPNGILSTYAAVTKQDESCDKECLVQAGNEAGFDAAQCENAEP